MYSLNLYKLAHQTVSVACIPRTPSAQAGYIYVRDELHDVPAGLHSVAAEHLLVTVQGVHLAEVRVADADYDHAQRLVRGSYQRSLHESSREQVGSVQHSTVKTTAIGD